MTWLTSAEFVAAVSEAGGAGVLGINAGQTVPTGDPVETAERLRAQIRRVRELTDKPFGVKDQGIINSSQAINNITSVKTCREVVDELNILA